MGYYDIDDILTDAQKLPCLMEVSYPGLGFIESTSASTDLKKGTRLQIPIWLAEMLAGATALGFRENIVSVSTPMALSPRVLNALKADPRHVELRQFATNFYGLGEKFLELFDDESIREVLIATYKLRAAEIADLAHNPQGAISGEAGKFLGGLDEQERALFRISHESTKAIKRFMEDVRR
ncbi:hypothetical protein EDC01DRAFT_63160 [Geopyxis carbonaria]|nr:hypothetical protein EDC01DRAFT_63160 [Geopyxis carbonaria]